MKTSKWIDVKSRRMVFSKRMVSISKGLRGFWWRMVSVPSKKDMPVALPIDGLPGDDGYTWQDWHRDARTEYPLRHFISEQLPASFKRAKKIFWNDPVYYLTSHLRPSRRYHLLDIRSRENKYSYGWMDTPERLLYASFALLVQFVEDEYPGYVDWDEDEESRRVRDEFIALYKWWKEERPSAHAENDGRFLGTGSRKSRLKRIFEPVGRSVNLKGSWRETSGIEHLNKSDELKKKDDEMLRRLIEIRHFLWT